MTSRRVIEKFVVELVAQDAKFRATLQTSAKESKSWGEQVQRDIKNAAKIGAAAATAAAAAATAIVNDTRQAIDAQAKFADRIGISVDALGELEHAADLSGVKQEQLRMGLQRMTRRLAEMAATGKGEAVPAIEALGLTIDQFAGKKPDEQFALITEAMEGVQSQSERTRIAMKLFDSEGVALVQIMNDGSVSLESMREEARELGLTLSDIDAAQVEQANDEITRAQKVGVALAQQFTVGLAPSIAAVAGMYTEASLSAGGFGTVSEKVGELAASAVGSIGDVVENGIAIYNTANKALSEFFVGYLRVQRFIEQNSISASIGKVFGIDRFTQNTQERLQNIDGLIAEYEKLGEDSIAALNRGQEREAAEGTFSERLLADLKRQREELQAELESGLTGVGGGLDVGFSSEAKEMETALKNIRKALKDLEPPWKKYADQVATAKSLLQAGKLSQTDYNNVIGIYKRELDDATGANDQWKKDLQDSARFADAAKTEMEKLNEELARAQELSGKGLISDEVLDRTKKRIDEQKKDLEDAANEMSVFAERAASNMQDAFADFLFDPFDEGLDGMLKSFGQTLQRMAAEAAAAQIFDALGVEDLLKGSSSGGGNFLSSAGSFIGGLFSADGGGFTGHGSRTGGLDGRGGFLAMLHPDETVVDHTKGQSVGGQVNHISISLPGVRNEREARMAGAAAAQEITRGIQRAQRYA